MERHTNQPEATTASEQTDELPVRQASQRTSSHDARLSRVLDYQARSLVKDDPLEANLGSVNSGLIRTALWLDEAIEQELEIGPPDIKRLPEISPAIETYLRVARQIDRFANIELRTSEARKPTKAAKKHAALCVDTESETNSNPSEDSAV